MLTARKMLFSDHSAPIISNVFEEDEDGDEGAAAGEAESGLHLQEEDTDGTGDEIDPNTPVLVAPSERFSNRKLRKKERRKKRFEQMMSGYASSLLAHR
jgi:hypothetical protein